MTQKYFDDHSGKFVNHTSSTKNHSCQQVFRKQFLIVFLQDFMTEGHLWSVSARDLLSYRTYLVLCLKTEKKGYSVVTRQVITILELINSNLNRRHMERVITRTLITRQLSVDVCLLQCLVSKTKVSFFLVWMGDGSDFLSCVWKGVQVFW